jgi:hypothetical protein
MNKDKNFKEKSVDQYGNDKYTCFFFYLCKLMNKFKIFLSTLNAPLY